MDPLTVTAAVGSLTATVFTLVKTIGAFVSTARNSRAELESVSRELISLQVCLEVLESDRRNGVLLKDDLETSLSQILLNVQICCGQIEDMLNKLKSSRFGRPVKWALQQKDQMNQFRSALETHKAALQMALQLNTISILVKDVRTQADSQITQAQKAAEGNCIMQEISNKVNDIARAQDHNPALQRVEEALSELSCLVKNVALNHPAIRSFSNQSCVFAVDTVFTVPNIQGIQEIEIILGNPFLDPFNNSVDSSKNGCVQESCSGGLNREVTASCSICSVSLTQANEEIAEARLQQLHKDWRKEWLSQLKAELITYDQQRAATTYPSIGSSSSTGVVSAASSLLGDVSLADMLSEVMSTASWDDTESHYDMSQIMSTPSSEGTARFDTASEAQRLRKKYESACERIRILSEEATDLESENAQLQEAHRQDMARLKARFLRVRDTPAPQIEALQQENEDLRREASILSETSVELQKEIEDSRQQRANLQRQLDGHEDIPRQTSVSIESLREELSRINAAYDCLKAINGALQKNLEDQSIKAAAAVHDTDFMRQYIKSMSKESESQKSSTLSIQKQDKAPHAVGKCQIIRITPEFGLSDSQQCLRLGNEHYNIFSTSSNMSSALDLSPSDIVVWEFVSLFVHKRNEPRETPKYAKGYLRCEITYYDTTYFAAATHFQTIKLPNKILIMSLSSTFADFIAKVCEVLDSRDYGLCNSPELTVLKGGEFRQMTENVNMYADSGKMTICWIRLGDKKKLGWTESPNS